MVLAACIVAVLMAAIDAGMLDLIVPSIQKEFNASQSTTGLLSSVSTLMLAFAQTAIPQTQLEGLVENYQAAFTTGVSQMFLVAAAVFLPMVFCFGLGYVPNPKSRKTNLKFEWRYYGLDVTG